MDLAAVLPVLLLVDVILNGFHEVYTRIVQNRPLLISIFGYAAIEALFCLRPLFDGGGAALDCLFMVLWLPYAVCWLIVAYYVADHAFRRN